MKDNIKFQAIKDFYSLLDEEFVIKYMFSFNKEMNEILDIGENKTISEKVKLLDEIVDKIFNNMKISKSEKKQLGEVFTPFSLVHEMVQTLPEEVWTNPDLKFLDPSVGMGQFPVVVVQKLMEGLKDWEKDEEKRYKHIMENMIYVCELNIKNMWIFNNLFDRENKYNLNFHRGSFLDEGFDKKMKEWNVEKFDIILGNPPYQEKVGPKKTQQLWGKFIIKSINILNNNMFLNVVHPGGWRFLTDNSMKELKQVYNFYTNKKLISAKFHSYESGKKTFGVETDYDLICLQNTKSNGDCNIWTFTDGYFKSNLKNMKVIPTNNFKLFEKLKASKNEEKINILHSYSSYETRKKYMNKEKNDKFKYPCVYGYPIKGLKLIYSNTKNNGHFGISKLILVRASIKSLLDIEGKYGMTQFASGIVDTKENLLKIQKVIDSDYFKQLKGYFLGVVSQNRNAAIDAPGNMFKFIKEFKKDFWKEFTEEELNESIKDEPTKISKSVGANISKDSYDFKIGEKYKYTGNSKKIKKGEVEIIKILSKTFRVKDINGNIADVAKSTLKINN